MPILYQVETWTMTAVVWAKLQAFRVRNQCRILWITWYNFITNDEVSPFTWLPDVKDCTPETDPVSWSRHDVAPQPLRPSPLPLCVPASSMLSVSYAARDVFPDRTVDVLVVGLSLLGSIGFVQTLIFWLRTLFCWHKDHPSWQAVARSRGLRGR